MFDFLQAAATYNTSDANALTLFYGGNVGRTGLNATTYMGLPVSDAPYSVNSQMFGAYDSYTRGQAQPGAGNSVCLRADRPSGDDR